MGPLSADRLFFFSALAFTVSFLAYAALNYLFPLPTLPPEEIPIEAFNPTSMSSLLNQGGWVLSIAGVVTFVLGLVARKKS